ncbi:hypothetical protein, partial [Bacillus cereus]|uniref:hypothetical protein n=1 Tax=Bacillus cereus TaxID=1396 RepID=UPI001EDD4E1F
YETPALTIAPKTVKIIGIFIPPNIVRFKFIITNNKETNYLENYLFQISFIIYISIFGRIL